MKAPRQHRLSVYPFGAVVVLLAMVAIWPWIAPAPQPSRPAEPDNTPPPPTHVDLRPLQAYSEVFDRPLFTPSRRPPPDAKLSASQSGGSARYHLLGLVTDGEARRALISEGNRRFEIIEGAALDGWTVAHIEQNRVVLSSPTGRMELRLHRSDGSRAGPPSAMTPTPQSQ